MKLQVDPLVRQAMNAALEYWDVEAYSEQLPARLSDAFSLALQLIRTMPYRGKLVDGLPAHYRRVGMGKHLPEYYFYYRINAKEERVLVYLLRHGVRNPYAPSTHRRKAGEAQQRAERERGKEEQN